MRPRRAAGRSPRSSTPTSTTTTPAAMPRSRLRPAPRCWPTPGRQPASAGWTAGLNAGDVIKVGRTVELECLDTPGHTMTHVCLLSHTDEPALFCGDTLFNAGAGNCHNGGDPQRSTTPSRPAGAPAGCDPRLPGHEYMARNLEFTLDREPDNAGRGGARSPARAPGSDQVPVTTLGRGEARQHLPAPATRDVIARLREAFPDIGAQPDAQDRVPEAARAAQQMVAGACAPSPGRC